MIRDLKDKKPNIHEDAFIADTACVIGDVNVWQRFKHLVWSSIKGRH